MITKVVCYVSILKENCINPSTSWAQGVLGRVPKGHPSIMDMEIENFLMRMVKYVSRMKK